MAYSLRTFLLPAAIFAGLAVPAAALAQASAFLQSNPAPIERSGDTPSSFASDTGMQPGPAYAAGAGDSAPGTGSPAAYRNGNGTQMVIRGVWARGDIQTVSANDDGAEIRVLQGRVNVVVRHPEQNVEIRVDLPGGQVALLKDGLYTFNAETNTARVVNGEALALNTAGARDGVTIKEAQQYSFAAGRSKATDVDRDRLFADVLPGGVDVASGNGYGEGGGYGGGYAEGGYGVYGYPYAAYGYPYYGFGYGYPGYYGFGYPYGFGLGFGFGYGGFGYGRFGGYGYRGGYGGFRGGYGGGFRGGRR